jgi:non-specific serine/threonine protein kinase
VLGLLKQLVDKSLVLVEEGDGAARYRMLETIRAYGLEQLAASGAEAAVRRRHAEYYLAFAELADAEMHGPQQPVALDRLEREYDNLRTALRWAVDAGEPALALRFGRALTLFWFFHGHFSEGRRWLESMLQVEDPALTGLRAWALNGAGVLACFQGDFAYASGLFTRSIELARAIDDLESVAFSLTSLSGAALYQNDVDRAVALAEESLAMFRRFGNKWNIGLGITNLIPALLGQGRLNDAMQLAEERLGLYEELGNPWGIATSYTNLGLVASAQDDPAQAEAFYREGLAHFAALGDKWGSYECLAGLAGAVAAQDQPEQAARLCGLTDALRETLGAIAPPAFYRFDQVTAALRARLGQAAWEAAWQAGRNLPLEAVIT